jgi:predicted ester cyclase
MAKELNMDTRTVFETFMNALESGDFETLAGIVAEDFEFSSHTRPPANKDQWLGISMTLRRAFPDLSYNFQIESVDGDRVMASNSFTGTHSQDLDLTAMGMGLIPATGIRIETPRDHGEGVVENGKVKTIHVHDGPGSGLLAVLQQVGTG